MTRPACNPRGNKSNSRDSDKTGCSDMAPVCSTSLPKADNGTTMLKNNVITPNKKQAHKMTKWKCVLRKFRTVVVLKSSILPLLPLPPIINSVTNSKNHNRNKYKDATTNRGDRVVTYCPSELRNKQCAFESDTAETTFQVVNVANIPDIVTQMFNNKTNPIQNGRKC